MDLNKVSYDLALLYAKSKFDPDYNSFEKTLYLQPDTQIGFAHDLYMSIPSIHFSYHMEYHC